MKNWVFSLVMLLLATPFFTFGNDLEVSWYTIDAGGGESANGSKSDRGSIGQPDASYQSTGNRFQVTGGFWTVGLIMTPGMPVLKIDSVSENSILFDWRETDRDIVLQCTTSLISTNWVDVYEGTNSHAEVPYSGERCFFRLIEKP